MHGFISRLGRTLVAGSVLLLSADATTAQCRGGELGKLTVPRPLGVSLFASSLAMDGNMAVVGSWADSAHVSCAGAVWAFHRQGANWVQDQKLLTADGTAFDYFGAAVAISGGVVVVGVPGRDDHGEGSGAVYVYRHDGAVWAMEAKLVPTDVDAGARLGTAVGISGDTIVAGAWMGNGDGVLCGTAYVFRFDGASWPMEAKLVPADGAAYDWFGRTVAISGDTVVVGAPYDDDNGDNSGSAYVFRRTGTTWAQKAKLHAVDGADGDWFGNALAVQGDVALIGAPYRSSDAGASGAAYLFRRSGTAWAPEQKLLATDGPGHDFFGYSVALAGNLSVIGTSLDGENGVSSGSGYVFRRQGGSWTCAAKLLPSDGVAYNFVGECAAISGDTALLGASAVEDGTQQVKLTYAFGGLSDCNGNGTLDLCDIAAGTSMDVDGNGVPDECEPQHGDVNCDGWVTFADISPFVLALRGEEAYEGAYPNCDWLRADCNNDGVVDTSDIVPFVRLLGRGG